MNNSTARMAIGALALTLGVAFSSPASAQSVMRTFYQNSGTVCRGVDSATEQLLTRQETRLINDSAQPATVVCNLMTDNLADYDYAPRYGVVSYVGIWARTASGSNRSMSCTMTEGYVNQPGAATYQPLAGNPKTLSSSGSQTIFEWIPTSGQLFLSPVNVRCVIPAGAELNDVMTVFTSP